MPAIVATQVLAAVITSSPGPIPRARNASASASVPEFTPTQCRDAAVGRELGLEPLERRPADEPAALQDDRERVLEVGTLGLRPAAQIEEGDAHQYDSRCSR